MSYQSNSNWVLTLVGRFQTLFLLILSSFLGDLLYFTQFFFIICINKWRVWHLALRLLSLRAYNSVAFAYLAAWGQVRMWFPMANPDNWEWRSTSCYAGLLAPIWTSIRPLMYIHSFHLTNIFVVERCLLGDVCLPCTGIKILNIQHMLNTPSCCFA